MDTEIIDGSVLVSCSYHNKFPQTGWLKTSEMYFLMVLEARSPNQANSRAVVPPEALWENPSLPLPASVGSWTALVITGL